ncbi:MAG: response regulator transcription factor [Elainellaceae cyanobacterium]
MCTVKPRVLLVEDELRLAQCLCLELQDAGYDVTMAHSGIKGLNALRAQSFDLVLLDWNLPQVSGLDICRQLRTKRDRSPVVMMSAYDDQDRQQMAYRAGVDEYLIKPFSVDQITILIGRFLSTDCGNVVEPIQANSCSA